jgi:hypothetical protein
VVSRDSSRQRWRLIERLRVSGCNLNEAEEFLSVLDGALKVLEQQRLLILDRLYP